jgi:M6 family metalloprotease-like protein
MYTFATLFLNITDRMMKKIAMLAMAMLLGTASLMARPGYSKPVDVIQPDGTTVTLLMHGDEFLSFITTTDGYTVVKADDGYYRYAEKTAEGTLQATETVARNPEVRNEGERAFLARQKIMICPDRLKDSQFRKSAASLYMDYSAKKANASRSVIWAPIDYSKFKGLVVLVEWNDRKFMNDNPKEFYQKLTSEKNYRDTSREHYPVDVEGSARDYFFDNSLGVFDPTFDVVGPITIDYSCTYPSPKKNGQEDPTFFSSRMISLTKAIMKQVNNEVDFTQYDLDNNGAIDMVYFIFAGYGSYVQGNDERYMWPHANDYSSISRQYGLRYDNKLFGRYACSLEIQDVESMASQHQFLDGIGTICHEFSHVLGLADHYDADYDGNGQAQTSGIWDVMDSGADLNYGLTPVGYNSFERYLLGFGEEPKVLDLEGNYQLRPFGKTNEAFILNTGTTDEDFFIENRQQEGWDRFLPGHGLLAWRVDTSNPNLWKSNQVNISPYTMCFELLCATPGKAIASGYAPYPGLGNIHDLTAETIPALLSSEGKEAKVDLFDINETDDGLITFHAGKNIYESAVEDFEAMAATTADAADVKGTFCDWTLSKATVEDTPDGMGNGNHVVKIMRSGFVSTSTIEKPIRKILFNVWNGNVKVKIGLKYKEKDQQNWTQLNDIYGKTTEDIAKNSGPVAMQYNTPLPAGCQLQISVLSTSSSSATYIDDFTVTYDKSVSNGIASVKNEPDTANRTVYNLTGQKVRGTAYKGIVISNGKKTVSK